MPLALIGGMKRSPLAARSVLVLALCAAPLLAACDTDGDIGAFAVDGFEDGVTRDTDGGAFRVMLESRDGLAVGDNTLIVRVGFHDPSDPEGPGVGVPGATVTLDASMPNGAGYLDGLEATELDDGRYLVEGVALDQAGVWRFELGVEVGETLDESVGFGFDVGPA